MGVLIQIFQLPIMILNFFGFIVAGIWLLMVGQWPAVVAGFFTTIFASFLLGLALLPGMIIAGPGIYFAKRGVTVGVYLFGFLSSLYTYAVITAWCGGVTFYFLRNAPHSAFWPLLVWSYGVATGPWTYMAQSEQSAPSFLAAFFAQVAYIIMMISLALGADLADGLQIFTLVTVVGVFFHMRLLAEVQRAQLLSPD